MSEAKLQAEIVKYLKAKDCYVIKARPGAGVPLGCPDIIFVIEGFWGAIEVKSTSKAPYKPLQQETLEKLNEWSWAKRVDPVNWPLIRRELDVML